MLANVLFVIQELVAQELLEVPAGALQARDTVDHVSGKVKSIQIVQDGVFGALLNRERIDPKVACTFPLVLDVSDLEALRPFLAAGDISFGDCLRDRARLGSGVLPFRDFFQFYRASRNVRWLPDDNTMHRFTEIMDRLSIRFFKKPLEAA